MNLWFEEEHPSGVKFSYKVKDILFKGKSDFQTIDIVETQAFGRMMLIDGLVMITDRDEFVYHEMLAHIPALVHGSPRRVLVIGGGDGGTVRELLKHKCVEKIVLCEIDEVVVDCAKKFFPAVAAGFFDEKVEVLIGDGIQYVKDAEDGSFDLVLVDSTDPIGPGVGLFTKEFYAQVARILAKNGVMACQSESPWYEGEILSKIMDNIKGGFSSAIPYLGLVPTYPHGSWTWTMAANWDFKSRIEQIGSKELLEIHNSDAKGLQFLNENVFRAAFALPNFYRQKLGMSTVPGSKELN